jgi:hypothetical protein
MEVAHLIVEVDKTKWHTQVTRMDSHVEDGMGDDILVERRRREDRKLKECCFEMRRAQRLKGNNLCEYNALLFNLKIKTLTINSDKLVYLLPKTKRPV